MTRASSVSIFDYIDLSWQTCYTSVTVSQNISVTNGAMVLSDESYRRKI